MKLRVLLPSLAIACLSAPAIAQIPNGGFETWVTPSGATYQDPAGWLTFNGLATFGGGMPTTEQGSPGAVGNYYATVTTRNGPFGLLQGVAISGDADSGAGGFAYSSRPAALTGQWQHGIQPQDTGMVAVYFTKWNAVTQSSDSVGGGVAVVLGSLSGWNAMNIPITYFSSATPDTAIIAIFSSMNAPVEGSFIKIDDLGFSSVSGIGENSGIADVIKLFPSPATDVFTVSAERTIQQVSVMDMTGRTVLEQGTNASQITLNVADLKPGRYLVQLRFAKGDRQVRSMVKQ